MGVEVWLPPGVTIEREGWQAPREIVDRCRICQEFVVFEGESPRTMELHLRRCVVENEELLREERERQHPEIMAPWDPEFHEWIRRHGQAVLEGRMKP